MKKTIVVVLICAFLASASLAVADDSKLSPDLRGYNSSTKVNVIVQWAPNAQTNCSGLFGLLGCVLGDVLKLGGSLLQALPLVNGVVASLDGPSIQIALE